MRPRIRTIKPEAFLDEELWDLEQELGAPVFRAFVGLWTQADREGRFEWRPRALKAAVVPYWDGDFSRVLDALVTRGFLRRYTVAGIDYGVIPSFKRHQAINAKESPSELPGPLDQAEDKTAKSEISTREPRVIDASSRVTGSSRVEGKGTEPNGTEPNDASATRPAGLRVTSNDLESLFSSMRKAVGKGSYRLQRSDYDRAQNAVAWANTDHPTDPLGALERSIGRFLKFARGKEQFQFWAWCNDPARWFETDAVDGTTSIRTRGGSAPVSNDFDETNNTEFSHG